jgi:hypothetical protein
VKRGTWITMLTAAALALCTCNDPASRGAHKRDSQAAPAPRKSPATPRAEPPAPPATRPPVVALAVDQSASMRGFATAKSIATAITDAEQAIRDVAQGSLALYSLGATAEKVDEPRLFDQTTYRKGAADLGAALDSPTLRDADVMVVFTDGQPTAAQGPLGMCTPAGTQVISDLHGWFATRLTAGTAAWMILDKIPFAGRFFLNCRDADKVPEIKSRLGKKLECDRHECSYLIPETHPQDRALVAIVLAKQAFADTASAVVQAYLQHRSGATAVRLHRSSRDRHSLQDVAASLVGAHAAYKVNVEPVRGDPETRVLHIRCPDGNADMAVRVCVRLRAPDPLPGEPLARMNPPEIESAQPLRDGRSLGDWLELPRGQSLDPAVLPKLYASRHECASLWPRYLELASAGRSASGAPGCTGGDGVEVHELITSCGCRAQPRTGSTEVRFVQRYRSTSADVERALAARELSADPRGWFEQPDRVNGLSELVHGLAALPAGDADPHVALRLVIDVRRP